MCGIAGYIDFERRSSSEDLIARVTAMTDRIRLRGPDDSGAWADAEAGVVLGHRRLSIIDLSPLGHQPMASADERFQIVFNGEIYNFAELRRELEALGHKFRGHSDTEVMLAAFVQWGVHDSLKRFVGMFAFALWDRRERKLTLARDRMGEKPLYYGWQGKAFLFGSELKALRAHPSFNASVDRGALALLMRHNYVPAPYSIFQGISKLKPGAFLELEASKTPGSEPVVREYWSLRDAAARGLAEPFNGTEAAATDELDRLLRQSVEGQMVADVPLGAFLSGGIDSSTIVGVMQALSSRPVKTFTIGFHEEGYNEAVHAKAVAQHLKTDHTELYVTPEEARAVIPKLPEIYDEPFSDSSQIPTFLVCELARRHVTVSLSGDAGDELFCGYPRYEAGFTLWRKVGWMPRPVRSGVGALVAVAPTSLLDRALSWQNPELGKTLRRRPTNSRWKAVSEVLKSRGFEDLYKGLMSHWKHPTELVPGSQEPPTALTDEKQWPAAPDILQRMMYLDMVSYLPDDILAKVDRAAMGVSLETRVPLLDYRIVEFAWRVPLSMKRREGKAKWLLRQVLHRYVPRELIERPKMGFGVPIDVWLRGPLKDWAESLISESRLMQEGYFSAQIVRQRWNEHLSGSIDWHYHLWDVLMFQAWLDASKQ
ncbi:MAG TPA: asparagine synthase (glutamine-hydrolyzing) [Planctomycetota bacterium]|nr:asparagine synthase (glutamine-hydrolyzing) [Planctomycetota bacterium]